MRDFRRRPRLPQARPRRLAWTDYRPAEPETWVRIPAGASFVLMASGAKPTTAEPEPVLLPGSTRLEGGWTGAVPVGRGGVRLRLPRSPMTSRFTSVRAAQVSP